MATTLLRSNLVRLPSNTLNSCSRDVTQLTTFCEESKIRAKQQHGKTVQYQPPIQQTCVNANNPLRVTRVEIKTAKEDFTWGPLRHIGTVTSARNIHPTHSAVEAKAWRRQFSTALPKNDPGGDRGSGYFQTRSTTWKNKRHQEKSGGNWHNCIKLFDEIDAINDRISMYHQERILHYEEQYKATTGVEQQVAESRLIAARIGFSIEQGLIPFKKNARFMAQLRMTLNHAPFHQLRAWSWPTKTLSDVLKADVEELKNIRRALGALYPYPRQYLLTSILENPIRVDEILHPHLWNSLVQALEFPLGLTTAKLGIAFKTFLAHYRVFGQDLRDAADILRAIRIMRKGGSDTQRSFDSFQHRFMTANHLGQMFVKHCRKNFDRVWKMPRNGTSYHKKTAVLRTLDKIHRTWDETMHIYYEDYMYILLRRLELMTTEDAQRRSLMARHYWYLHWKRRDEHMLRLKQVDRYYDEVREARNVFRGKMRSVWKKSRVGKRVDPANERPSQGFDDSNHLKKNRPNKKHKWTKE